MFYLEEALEQAKAMIYFYQQNEKEIELMTNEELELSLARSYYLEQRQENLMTNAVAQVAAKFFGNNG